jgi:hypothetical protein
VSGYRTSERNIRIAMSIVLDDPLHALREQLNEQL